MRSNPGIACPGLPQAAPDQPAAADFEDARHQENTNLRVATVAHINGGLALTDASRMLLARRGKAATYRLQEHEHKLVRRQCPPRLQLGTRVAAVGRLRASCTAPVVCLGPRDTDLLGCRHRAQGSRANPVLSLLFHLGRTPSPY